MWLVECPFSDQGLVRPMVTAEGRVVLSCDTCSTVWCRPEDIDAEKFTVPMDYPDWRTGCGDTHVSPGTVRWAEQADVERAGWGDLEWRHGGEFPDR